MNNKLGGKIAMVTGASRGIGRAVTVALARAGADVVIIYRNEDSKAAALAGEIENYKVRSMVIRADVSEKTEIDRLFREIKNFGNIDILVNNVGIARPQQLTEITLDDWNEMIRTNLTSAFLATQAALPSMIKNGYGRIINISSVAAQVGGVVGPHYAASKAGLHGLTHYFANNLAQTGITVNVIAPALIDTDMIKGNPRIKPEIIPMKRFGNVEEVADVVLMLVNNGYINGQTINVNGGWYMS